MLISKLAEGRTVADVARMLGAPYTSVMQWIDCGAIVLNWRIYTRVKRIGGLPDAPKHNWAKFDGVWYRMSCARKVKFEGSTWVSNAQKGVEVHQPYVMTAQQTAKLASLMPNTGASSLPDALDRLLGICHERTPAPVCALTSKQYESLESLGLGSWSEALDAILGLAKLV